MDDQHFPLGRVIPPDFVHVDRYPLRAVRPTTILIAEVMLSRRFSNAWRNFYDQMSEGKCVGAGQSQVKTFYDRMRYDMTWLWNEAKKIDGIPWTNPGDNNGTTLRAGFDVQRDIGHVRVWGGVADDPSHAHGITANRWCLTVDEMRAAIANGDPVVMGTNWYEAFDRNRLEQVRHRARMESRVRNDTNLGRIRGGHCYVFFDASDARQAFRTPNSWGTSYPWTWFPYEVVERLLREDGEAGVVSDR